MRFDANAGTIAHKYEMPPRTAHLGQAERRQCERWCSIVARQYFCTGR
jgi:hypothetical protein